MNSVLRRKGGDGFETFTRPEPGLETHYLNPSVIPRTNLSKSGSGMIHDDWLFRDQAGATSSV
jgi:hypothetical protein